MLEDLYVRATIGRHRVAESSGATPHMVRGRLAPKLRQWGGKWLEGLTVSGSYAKGTAIRGESLATELPGAELRDPANRSNVVSEVMTGSERWRVAHAAGVAGQAKEWREVI